MWEWVECGQCFPSQPFVVKSIILKNFKTIQKLAISFKRDKNTGNFLVRSSFQTNDHSGTFKCTRSRCNTCPFIHNVEKISGPKRSIKITDHFTCTSANVIYCITCTYCNKLYIGETGRRLGDRFREHLRDVERNDKDASKLAARHFNLPNRSKTTPRSLRPFPTSRQYRRSQNTRTKVYLPNRHS